MALIRHDDHARDRANRDPEFARLRRETAIELLVGNDEDRRVAMRILRHQLCLPEDEIRELQRNSAAA